MKGQETHNHPGLRQNTQKPLGPSSSAYCAVSIFSAAFEILYAGLGDMANCLAREMEPTVLVILTILGPEAVLLLLERERSGRKVEVTRWTKVTLVEKVRSRSLALRLVGAQFSWSEMPALLIRTSRAEEGPRASETCWEAEVMLDCEVTSSGMKRTRPSDSWTISERAGDEALEVAKTVLTVDEGRVESSRTISRPRPREQPVMRNEDMFEL